jgi:hypothetical protein
MVHRTKKKIKGLIDVIQKYGKKLKKPEIRVWVHPKKGDDFYYVFKTLKMARIFSKEKKKTLFVGHPYTKLIKVEPPLVAYKGYEMNVSGFKKQFPKVKLT